MDIGNWKRLNEEIVYSGRRKIVKRTYKMPDGKEHDFEIINDGKAVHVFAITSEGKVILAKQFRPGAEKVYDELVAGIVDEGEDVLEAAKRELLEETGYTGDFEFVNICLDHAYSSMQRFCFIAKNCRKVQEPKLDGSEFIEVVHKSVEEFKEQIKKGNMAHLDIAYICLHKLGELKF